MTRGYKFIPPLTSGGNRDKILDNIDNKIGKLVAGSGAGGATEVTLAAMAVDLAAVEVSVAAMDIDLTDIKDGISDINTEPIKYGKHVPMPDIETITLNSGAIFTLTPPLGAVGCIIFVESNAVRVRFGVDPVAAADGGIQLKPGDIMVLGELNGIGLNEMTDFRAIRVTPFDAILNVQYYTLA